MSKRSGSRACAALVAVLLASPAASAGEFDCIVEPSKSVEVRAASEGLIEKIHVDRGDLVSAGQVLVTLDSGAEREAVESARFRSTMRGRIQAGESRVEYANARHARREKLVEESFIAVQDRDEALAEKRLAEAEGIAASEERRLAEIEYRRLSEQLRLRTIRSPVSGVVVDRLLNAGELADNRDLRKPILRLADINTLHVEVLMPIDALGKVKRGQSVVVLPEPRVGGRYTATVKVVDQVHDAASGTFGVRLELPNPGLKLPAGIKCKAVFPSVGNRADMLPAAAPRPSLAPVPAAARKSNP
jgi:RND family efflux transporter MFP subunit